ncbi:hypothetical protein, partial [Bacillus sp. mrc49]
MFINKLRFIDNEKQQLYFKALASFLLPFFTSDYYSNELDLQQDFTSFQDDESYLEILEEGLNHCEDALGIKLGIQDLIGLTPKRWKLCLVCGDPFLSYDKFNKSKICYSTTYKRFKVGQGTYFKAAQEGASKCYM